MAANWRVHRTLAYVVMGFTAAALLGFGGIALEEKAFDLIQWKYLVLAGQGYLAWTFKNLLNF